MLTVPQRLIGLYILYELYRNENVKTTPFYQLMLDLLSSTVLTHPAEKKLLTELVKSMPKFSKITPSQYIKALEEEESAWRSLELDLEPHRKAHSESMPCAPLIHSSSVSSIIMDNDNAMLGRTRSGEIALDEDETELNECLPVVERPIPAGNDESYLIEDVLVFLLDILNQNIIDLLYAS